MRQIRTRSNAASKSTKNLRSGTLIKKNPKNHPDELGFSSRSKKNSQKAKVDVSKKNQLSQPSIKDQENHRSSNYRTQTLRSRSTRQLNKTLSRGRSLQKIKTNTVMKKRKMISRVSVQHVQIQIDSSSESSESSLSESSEEFSQHSVEEISSSQNQSQISFSSFGNSFFQPPEFVLSIRNLIEQVPPLEYIRPSETIIIPDDQVDPLRQNEEKTLRKWYLEKNRTLFVQQLTKEQLEKHEKCPVCHVYFQEGKQSKEKIQMTEKVQSGFQQKFKQNVRQKMETQPEHQPKELLELFCKHIFHKECITTWLLNSKPLCPCCRKDFRKYEKEYKNWKPKFLEILEPTNQRQALQFHVEDQYPQIMINDYYMPDNFNESQVILIEASEEFLPNMENEENQDSDVYEIIRPKKQTTICEFLLQGWSDEEQVQIKDL